MKRRALAVVLTLMMIVSVLPMAAFAAKFSDTVGHWAESSIDRWTDEGVLQGVGDNMFMPNEFITRAQASAIFTRLLKLTNTADVSQFTDVEADSWYVDYVAHVVAYHIFNGTSATTFNPGGFITRQDFFLTLARALGIPEQATCYNTSFQDLNQVSAYAQGAVYALVNLGYVNGRSATELQPLAYITRAEVAKVLDNVISYYITEDGSYNVSGDKVAVVLAPSVAIAGPFSGTVVAAAENGTVDLGGVTQPVKINAVRPNVKVKNAPANSVGTSDPNNGQGLELNGVPVEAGDSQTVPGSETPTPVTPAAGGGGGGGTGNPSSQGGQGNAATYKASLNVSLAKANGGTNTFVLRATGISDTATVDDVISALFTGDENRQALSNAVTKFLTNFRGTEPYTVGGTEYVMTIDNNGVITMTKGGNSVTDLDQFINAEQAVFEQQAKNAAVAAGLEEGSDVYNKWLAFTATFSPKSQFKTISGTSLTMADTAGYMTKVDSMVTAFTAFRASATSISETDLAKLFAEGTGIFTSADANNLAILIKSGDTLSTVAGTYNILSASLTSATIATINTIVGTYTNADYFNVAYEGTSYSPYAYTAWNSAMVKDGIKGNYSATLTIVQE